MRTPERLTNTTQEIPRTPEGKRISPAYHLYFSRYHHDLHRSLVNLLSPEENEQVVSGVVTGRRFPIGYENPFPDGSPFYAVLERDNLNKSDVAIAPAWIAPPFPDAIWSITEMSNAFTQSSTKDEPILTKRFICLFPYAELRQDKNTPKRMRTYWDEEAREAISAQIVANMLASNGVTESIFLHPHSAEAIEYFDQVMETLCITPAPLYVNRLRETEYTNNKDKDIVALDEGGAQQAHHLAQLTDSGLIVFKKDRPKHGEISKQDLIVGKPQAKNAIVIDDLSASCKSILEITKSCQDFGYKSISILVTHVVFSGAYLDNIRAMQNLGIVKDFAITNSLPKAEEAPFLPIRLNVIPIEQTLSFFAKHVAISSIEEVKNNPHWQDWILTPRPKEEVIEELKAIYG